MYAQMKREKAQEIVMMLDLFDGKITLTEIMDTDMSLLNQLRDAKIDIMRRQDYENKRRQAATLPLTNTK